MKTIKVYVGADSLYFFFNSTEPVKSFPHVYVSKGVLKDRLRNVYGVRGKLDIVELELTCPDDFRPGYSEVLYPIAVYTQGDQVVGLGMEDAHPHFDEPTVLCSGYLCNTVYSADKAATRVEYLKADDRGRLFVRMNLHPDEDGLDTRGRVYFPDRSFKGAQEGYVVVDVASVKERDTFGFFRGRMLRFGEFDMGAFLDWAYDNKDLTTGRAVHICEDSRGKFMVVPYADWSDYIQVSFSADGVMHTDVLPRLPHEKSIKQVTTLGMLYLQDRFGEGLGSDILDKFVPATCWGFRYSDSWVPVGGIPTGCPDLVAAGLSQGFLKCERLGTRPVYVYRVAEPAECVSFSDEELEAMAEQFNGLNAAADAAVQSAIKKGNLVVRCRTIM